MAYLAPIEVRLGRTAVNVVDTRYVLAPAIHDLRTNSIDPYATARTVYLQHRASEIRNGLPPTGNESYEGIFKEEPDVDQRQ